MKQARPAVACRQQQLLRKCSPLRRTHVAHPAASFMLSICALTYVSVCWYARQRRATPREGSRLALLLLAAPQKPCIWLGRMLLTLLLLLAACQHVLARTLA